MQIITFIFVVLPLLFIISLFQRKKKRPIVRKDYGITLVLGIIGVFLASIILTLTKDGSALSINLILGSNCWELLGVFRFDYIIHFKQNIKQINKIVNFGYYIDINF